MAEAGDAGLRCSDHFLQRLGCLEEADNEAIWYNDLMTGAPWVHLAGMCLQKSFKVIMNVPEANYTTERQELEKERGNG